ncbi:AraC family transcriptional regulator [Ruminococcus sp.]|uniref:helix-turn-helix transcriptional regulator n=1 Tax=Ruminococcus sp. TaxID=41978 RepID=UPI001B1D3BE0|nr:AraC family transcriptional regulator [Ruminococcus sp.]MBO5557364.1 helix-turn-helix transcriptional regulator [Ruminococcus sp.]
MSIKTAGSQIPDRTEVPHQDGCDSITAERLRQIRAEICTSPGDWSVERMAKSFYMTRSHFSVLYKKQFGISPGEDIREMTMQYAADLLDNSQLSIADISKKCGYTNCENFIRGFKKHFGITPLKYRHRQ